MVTESARHCTGYNALTSHDVKSLLDWLMCRKIVIEKAYNRGARRSSDHLELAKQYYNFRRQVVNHCEFDFLINGSGICSGSVPFVLIIVPSVPHDYDGRKAIRETWGRYAKDLELSPPYQSFKVALAFLLGRGQNESVYKTIINESNMFNDIVLGDFLDSYFNLTRKVLMGLKWTSLYCERARHVLKIDSDTFVHVPRLVEMLNNSTSTSTSYNGRIYGYLYLSSRVQRRGRWAVTPEEYPLPNYPPYMSGNSYVISGDIVKNLWLASQFMPYLPIEDVFITGIMSLVIGAQHIERKEFTWWGEKASTPCIFMIENKITGNGMTTSLMKTMWTTLLNYSSFCKSL